MNTQLKSFLTIVLLVGGLLGCGGDTRPADRLIGDGTMVTVERGAVVSATVKDANGIVARDYNNSNVYVFDTLPTYPLSVSNGIIYLDTNISKKVFLDINMSSYTNTITPITTILTEANGTKRAYLEQKLISDYGLTKEELYSIPSQVQNSNLAVLTNLLYKKAKESNSTLRNIYKYEDTGTLKSDFDSFKGLVENNSSLMVNGIIDTFKLENYLYDTNNSLFSLVPLLLGTDELHYSVNDDIEDIWKITFGIKNENFSNIYIGIKIIKHENDGTPDIGEFVYSGVNITNGVISNPTRLDVYGKGDSNNGTNIGYSDPKDAILQNIFELKDGRLSLNLGYAMKQQTMVSESSFKVATTYEIYISASENIFLNSSKTTINYLTTKKYDFIDKEGMSGEIIIK